MPCILSNLWNDRSGKYLISSKNRFILAFNQNSSRATSTTTFDFIKTIRITEFRERSVPSPLIADQFSNFRGVVADSEGKKEARLSGSIRPDYIYVWKETRRILPNRVFHPISFFFFLTTSSSPFYFPKIMKKLKKKKKKIRRSLSTLFQRRLSKIFRNNDFVVTILPFFSPSFTKTSFRKMAETIAEQPKKTIIKRGSRNTIF